MPQTGSFSSFFGAACGVGRGAGESALGVAYFAGEVTNWCMQAGEQK